MGWLDWTVFLGFLAWVVWDGARRGRGTKDLEGYFAGGRSIPWWAAGLSIMATQASAITMIGTTGQGHDSGMEFVQFYFGLAIAMVIHGAVLVPIFRGQPVLTAYEYLERRFSPAARTLASLIFLASRCLAFGVVIYAPSVVLSAMLALPVASTTVAIGAITTAYTMLGGVQAVIWTDVKQMAVMVGGLLVAFGILLSNVLLESPGGLGDAIQAAGAMGRMAAVEFTPASTDWVPRWAGGDGAPSFWEDSYNFWSGILGGTFLQLAYFGADQSQVQRVLTSRTMHESRLALLMSAVWKVPMQAGILFLGVLLLLHHVHADTEPLLHNPELRAAFAEAPERERITARFTAARSERKAAVDAHALAEGVARAEAAARIEAAAREVDRARAEARRAAWIAALAADPETTPEDLAAARAPDARPPTDRNYIFPGFLLAEFPPLLLGLMLAAIFAAAMSSSDSALNSLTSSAVVDIHKRWFRPEAAERTLLRDSRVYTILFGTLATTAALGFQGEGAVIVLVNRIGSFFYGALLGVFLLAVLVRRAGGIAACGGLVAGMAAVLAVHSTLEVAFLWYNVVGACATVATGLMLSPLDRPRLRS